MKGTEYAAYRIRPGHRLFGKIAVQGSKNSLLPILAASILRPGPISLHHLPHISDKDALCGILEELGCAIRENGHSLYLDTENAKACAITPERMKKTRGGFLFLGAMLARFGFFCCSLPGGCSLGKRPIDFHLNALQKMGVLFSIEGDTIHADGSSLHGAVINLPFPSVGATQNILLAACGANGVTVLHNAAIEPEVIELIDFLALRGFQIRKSGKRSYTILGMPNLMEVPLACSYTLTADRIAAVTLLAAAAITGGNIHLPNIEADTLGPAIELFEKAGCEIQTDHGIQLFAPDRLHGIGSITTDVHPGFATDMQPLFAAMASLADSPSAFTETIFENRFSHCAQLCQMGAKITIRGKTAFIAPNDHLIGRDLLAFDLRGGAALTVAALAAEGESMLHGICYIARGYEDLAGDLRALGADITLL